MNNNENLNVPVNSGANPESTVNPVTNVVPDANIVFNDTQVSNGNMVPNGNNKKSNKGIFVLIIILLVGAFMALLVYGGYKMGLAKNDGTDTTANINDNTDKKESNEKTENEDNELKEEAEEESEPSIITFPEKNSRYTFYKEKRETINLTDGTIEILAFYYLDEVELEDSYGRSLYNLLRRDIYVNGKQLGETVLISVIEGGGSASDTVYYDNITENKIFMDSYNKDDVVIYFLSDVNGQVKDGVLNTLDNTVKYAYILSKKGEVYKKINIEEPFYGIANVVVNASGTGDRNFISIGEDYANDMGLPSDYTYALYNEIERLDIHDKYIYYLVGDCDTLDEYKLIIENGKLKEEKTATYSGNQIQAAGGC